MAGALATMVLIPQFVSLGGPRPARAGPEPCGTVAAPPPASTITHVVWIVMENKGYSSVVGSANAPYINGLAAKCGLATNLHTGESTTLTSLAHYIAMTSGSTQGVTDDKPPSAHPLGAPSIFSQLGTGGWRALQESMPANCYKVNSGLYAVRRNPAAYYTNLGGDCAVQDVPLGAAPDISAPFTFITPNLRHDMHRTATTTTTASQVRAGDDWLAAEMPLILNSPEYVAGSTAVFVTWDEGTSSTDHIATLAISPYTVPGTQSATPFTHCSLLKAALSSPEYLSGTTAIFLTWDEGDATSARVPTVVISPYTAPGTQSDSRFDHYSMLRTTEELLGLPVTLGHAADPTTASMRLAFNLDSPLPGGVTAHLD